MALGCCGSTHLMLDVDGGVQNIQTSFKSTLAACFCQGDMTPLDS